MKKNKKNIILHVGLHKTGSRFLQRQILPFIKDIYCTGIYKQKFDNVLISEKTNKYNAQSYYIKEIKYEISFAVCTTMSLIMDLNGNVLYSDSDISPSCYINIFPQNNKSYILISWFKEHDETYSQFINSIKNQENKLFIYLNNFIPLFVRNTVLSPRLWLNWNCEQQNEYKDLSINSIPLRLDEILSKYYMFEKRAYNLFEKH